MMLGLYPIRNDHAGELSCGPAAVCMVAGYSASRVVPIFQKLQKLRDGKHRRGPVTTTDHKIIILVLAELGLTAKVILEPEEGDEPILLRQWLATTKRWWRSAYLVCVHNHVVAVCRRHGGDNSTIVPVPLPRMPCLDERIDTIIEVRELRESWPSGVSAERLKRIRSEMRISAATLAAMLLLGKGGDRTVRRWESGMGGIPGPAQVAIGLLWERDKAARRGR